MELLTWNGIKLEQLLCHFLSIQLEEGKVESSYQWYGAILKFSLPLKT